MDGIAIIGVGCISPFGNGYKTLIDGVFNNSNHSDSTIQVNNNPIVAASYPYAVKRKPDIDRAVYFSKLALDESIAMSELALSSTKPERIGAYIGCSMGGMQSIEEANERFFSGKRVSPLTIVKGMSNAALAEACKIVGATGSSANFSVACSSSAYAVHYAKQALQLKEIDLAIVGGVETPLFPSSFAAWEAMGVMNTRLKLDERGCRPFSKKRNGLILGEGASYFMMQRLSDALKQKQTILAVVSASSISNDNMHLTKPSTEIQQSTIVNALKSANLSPLDIDHYNAHGTGTQIGDIAESHTITGVWGRYSTKLDVSATKSITGHLLGASGAIELAICIGSIERSMVPASVYADELDENFKANLVMGNNKEKCINHALSTSFAFGGHNAAIIISKHDYE